MARQVSARGGTLRLRDDGSRVAIAGQAVTVLRGELLGPCPSRRSTLRSHRVTLCSRSLPRGSPFATAVATPERPSPARPVRSQGPPELPAAVGAATVPAFWTRTRLILAVVLLLGVHALLAVTSLVRENPTVDEVAHLPAGITYWQTGTFRLYPHNPPLVKLAAALPVVLAHPAMERIYSLPSWKQLYPVHASIAHEFAVENPDRYFELFTLARMVIPAFSVLGGLVVFLWSRRLYGPWGGLLSLSLWVFCPNVLAHARLVTTDIGATTLGILGDLPLLALPETADLGLGASRAGLGLATAREVQLSAAVRPLAADLACRRAVGGSCGMVGGSRFARAGGSWC